MRGDPAVRKLFALLLCLPLLSLAACGQAKNLEDPTQLSKAELVRWYNERVNDARSRKPEIAVVETRTLDSFSTSLGAALDSVISPIAKQMMPGDPAGRTIGKGSGDISAFLFTGGKSAVKADDLNAATAAKAGGNYVVTLSLGSETNPNPDGSSKYSRVMSIASREDVLAELAGASDIKIVADPNNATMVYENGRAAITVNQKGEIVAAETSFHVTVNARVDTLFLFADFDAAIDQTTTVRYFDFVY